MSSTRRVLFLAAAMLLVLSLNGCEGGTLLDGIIMDKAGTPIAFATVTLEVIGGPFDKAQEQSNNQGAYRIHVTHYPQRTYLAVTVFKEGFVLFKKKFLSKGIYQHLDVTLKPADESSVRASQ